MTNKDFSVLRAFSLLLIFVCCSLAAQAQMIIFSEDFQNGVPATFGNIDVDAFDATTGNQTLWAPPGTPWIALLEAQGATNVVAASTSWFAAPGQANDWLVTPQIAILAGTKLNWRAQATDANFADGYEVYISTTGNTVADFTGPNGALIFSVAAENPSFTDRSVDLAPLGYANQNVYFAFRNNSNDMNILFIDDIEVIEAATFDAAIASTSQITEYGSMPLNHISPLTISADVENVGLSPVTNVNVAVDIVDGNGTSVYSTTLGPLASLAVGAMNTLTDPTPFMPTTVGTYTTTYNVTIAEPDTDLTNNTGTASDVTISDSTYSRHSGDATNGLGIASGSLVMGQVYEAVTNDVVTSVTFGYVGGAAGDTLRLEVYSVNAAGAPDAMLAATPDFFVVTPGTFPVPPTGPELITIQDINFPVVAGTKYFLGLKQYDNGTSIGLATSENIFTNNTCWVSINGGAWGTNESLNFPITYWLSPNFGAPPCATFAVTPTITDDLCGTSQGAAALAVTGGGAGNYTYEWDAAAGGQTTAMAMNLAAGTYSVTISDGPACTTVESITVGGNAAVLANATATPANCNTTDGTASAAVTGGTAPYLYAWDDPMTQTTATATGLPTGNYTVMVTDANGCTAMETVTVGNANGPNATNVVVTDVDCNGNASGGISVDFTGGAAPYTFSWNGIPTPSEDLANVGAGTYTGQIIDASNCSFIIGPITITEPDALGIANATITDVDCNGAATGAIDVTIIGGVTPYTYAWSNGATTEDLTDLIAGSYTGTITDANGCVLATPVPVPITEPTAVAIGATLQDVLCNGDATGAVSIDVSGGVAPYTFSWSNGATTEDISGITAGAYTGSVTDANGCETVAGPVNISEPAAIDVTPQGISNPSCNGDSDGFITVTTSGGTAPYTWMWSNGEMTENVSNLASGSYSVDVTDANGCLYSSISYQLSDPAVLDASAVITDATVGGTDGAIDLTVIGGTAPYSFSWSNGETTEDLTGLAAGPYTGTITDANNCVFTATLTVMENVSTVNIKALQALEITPNPTAGEVLITLELDRASEVQLDITNVTGQKLQSITDSNVNTKQYQLNLSNYASGVYFARFTISGQTITKRIVLNK